MPILEDNEEGINLAFQQREEIVRMLREAHPQEMLLLALCEKVIARHQERAKRQDKKSTKPSDNTLIEDYSRYPRSLQAVVEYLHVHDPTLRRKVAPEVVRCGWGKNQGKSRKALIMDIRAAVSYQTKHAITPIIGFSKTDGLLYVIERSG